MKKIVSSLLLLVTIAGHSQLADHIYKPNIRSVKLYKAGDMLSYPVMMLNSADMLELQFDDMDADVKNCYYTYQLCNADWSPAPLQAFDYIRGFQSNRITTYRYSSISQTKYTHYQAVIPDRNCVPIRSGNYLLKVFLNSDTSNVLFTKRFLVIDNRVSVAAQIVRPFNPQISLTDQRVRVGISTKNSQLNILSGQDLKVVVLQNNIWPTSVSLTRANIYRGDYFEFNDDVPTFPAGREWRWIDIRSMRLMSDRMEKLVDTAKRIDVFVKPDLERKTRPYIYYHDVNGIFTLENQDGYNPEWQSDYGYVHFTYVPPGNQAYGGKDLYLFGELTNFSQDDAYRMVFNQERGVYEGTLFLKQGFYNYNYALVNTNDSVIDRYSFSDTEGNSDITENFYTVLVYYKPFGGRYEQLVGYSVVNTLVATR